MGIQIPLSARSTRLEELAATVTASVATISSHLQCHDIPQPSFDPGSPASLPDEVCAAQDSALSAVTELYDLLVNPLHAMVLGSPANYMSLDVIRRFKVANLFEPDQTSSFAEIAARTGLRQGTIKHVLRHAMTLRVFREPSKGVVAHTARSVLLRSRNVADSVGFCTEEINPAASKAAEAFEKWPRTEDPNETGFALANNDDRALYDILKDDPARANRFANNMTIFSRGPAFSISHLVNGYDWSALGHGTIVDVGGSRGHVAVELVSKYPELRVIVQDQPATVDNAEKDIPSSVAGRVSFMPHDFFQDQPVQADVYLLRCIMHNWADKYCLKILRALVPAMKTGARVLINEVCLPEPGEIPLWKERVLRTTSLTMMGLFNAHERDEDDWRELLRQADSRFEFVDIHQPTGSQLVLIEAKWIGTG